MNEKVKKVLKWVKIGAALAASFTIVILIVLLRRAKNAQTGDSSVSVGSSVGSIGGNLSGQAHGIDVDLEGLHNNNEGAIGLVAKLEDTNRRLADWIRSVQGDG